MGIEILGSRIEVEPNWGSVKATVHNVDIEALAESIPDDELLEVIMRFPRADIVEKFGDENLLEEIGCTEAKEYFRLIDPNNMDETDIKNVLGNIDKDFIREYLKS